MFSSFKDTSNLRDKHPVFDSCGGERQFPNFEDAKQTDASLWNLQSKSYNLAHSYPGDQITTKLQTMSAHNQTMMPTFEHKVSVHSNSLHCPYPNNSNQHTLVRPTAVINCHSSTASCCGHPNRLAQHWNPVPQNIPVTGHFMDNISSHNSHSNLSSEEFRLRTENFYGPMNRQPLNQRESMGVNQTFYSRQLRNAPTAAAPLPPTLSTANRTATKYVGSNPGQRTEACTKCSGNCNESCEFFGNQQMTDYTNSNSLCADTSHEFVRDNVVCYGGLHSDSTNPAAQLCAQWPSNVSPQSEYCRQSNNTGMWLNNSHNLRIGNGLPPPGYWTDKKASIPRNVLPQYPLSRLEHRGQMKDQQDSLRPQEMKRMTDISCVQTAHMMNGYSEAIHQQKEKLYNGNMCNHVQGERGEEVQKGSNSMYFKDKEAGSYQNFNQFGHMRQVKHQDVLLNDVHGTPQEGVIFQESQTFTSSRSHPISVQPFSQPGVAYPYSKSITKPCFQNPADSHIPPQDATVNSFALPKVTETFTTGIAQPPSRFSSHLTYTQSRISKTNNEFCYFPDISGNSGQPASNSYIDSPLGVSVQSSDSPENSSAISSSCAQSVEAAYGDSDSCKTVTNTLNPLARSEHNFNCNTAGSISDLHSCKRLQDSNLNGKLMQVIDTSNINLGIKECTDASCNNGANVLKNISSYTHSSEYNIYSGNVPSSMGPMSFESCGENVAFPNNQAQIATFSLYDKQFDHGPAFNAEVQSTDVTATGPNISSVPVPEDTRGIMGITSTFCQEKNSLDAAVHSVRRSKSHVNDAKSEYRGSQDLKQRSNKTGQLDVRQFLATWDEENEDVASPRLPDVVLSSSGTPLYVVECGGGGFSEVSTVASNSTNDETLQRNEVIRVYEHIQPVQMIETDIKNTQASDLRNVNADTLSLLNISNANHSEALNSSVNVLYEDSINETGVIDFSHHPSLSTANVEICGNNNVGAGSGISVEEECDFSDRERRSPDCNTRNEVKHSRNISSEVEDRVSAGIHSGENSSGAHSENCKDYHVSNDKMISNSVVGKHEEQQLHLQSDTRELLQEADITRKHNCDDNSSAVLSSPTEESLNSKKTVASEDVLQVKVTKNDFQDSRNIVMPVSRNNSLDDIAADAFEKLTSGNREKTLSKDIPRNSMKNDNLDVRSEPSCEKVSHSNMKTCVSDECVSEYQSINILSETTFRAGEKCTEQSALNEKEDKVVNILEDTCKRIITSKNCISMCEQNDRILPCVAQNNSYCSEIKSKESEYVYSEASEFAIQSSEFTSQTEKVFRRNVDEINSLGNSDPNYIKSNSDNEAVTVTNVNAMKVVHSSNISFPIPLLKTKRKDLGRNCKCRWSRVTGKCESLERSSSCHNPQCPLKILKIFEKLSSRFLVSDSDVLLRISNRRIAMNYIWQNYGKQSVERIESNVSKVLMENMFCSTGELFSTSAITPNKKKSMWYNSLFSKESFLQRSVSCNKTANFSLPIDMILDEEALQLIRRKLIPSKHLNMHNQFLKSNRNKFLVSKKSTPKKSSLSRCSKLICNSSVHERRKALMTVRLNLSANDEMNFSTYGYQNVLTTIASTANHDKFRMTISLRGNIQCGNKVNFYVIQDCLKTLMGQVNTASKINGRNTQYLQLAGSVDSREQKLEATILLDICKDNLPKFSLLSPSSSSTSTILGGQFSDQSRDNLCLEISNIKSKILEYYIKTLLHSSDQDSQDYIIMNAISSNFRGFHMLKYPGSLGCLEEHKSISEYDAICSREDERICKRQINSFKTSYNTCKSLLNVKKKKFKIREEGNSSAERMSYEIIRKLCKNQFSDVISKESVEMIFDKNRTAEYCEQILCKKILFDCLYNVKDIRACSSHIVEDKSDTDLEKFKEWRGETVLKGEKVYKHNLVKSRRQSTREEINNCSELLTVGMGLKRIITECSPASAVMNFEQIDIKSFSYDKGNNNNTSHRKKQKHYSVTTSFSQSHVPENNDSIIPVGSSIQFCKEMNVSSSANPFIFKDHNTHLMYGNDAAETSNSKLSPTKVNITAEGCFSTLQIKQTDIKQFNKENSMMAKTDDSEIVISSTSSLTEEQAEPTSSDLSKAAQPLYLFEDDLPDVESYVDANEVTLVTGTQDDVESGTDIPCVVVYPESGGNVFHSQDNVCTSISSVDACSESDVITTAIISQDVCMNSNCIIVSEDESSGPPHQHVPTDFLPCTTQERDDVEFRHFSPGYSSDEYQNSTVSSTTNISEIGDSTRVRPVAAAFSKEHAEAHDISTSNINGNLPFFGEEIDFYNSGVLQADSVSDWPYLEEEVMCELQNSDVEGDVPLGNTFCEKSTDRIFVSNCSPVVVNKKNMDKETELCVINVKENCSSDTDNKILEEEQCEKKDIEFTDLKCRLSWDKIFDLPKKGQQGYKIKRRERKIVTKSWPYYCKTQNRWKWPRSSDALYRKMSRKTKQINVLCNIKKNKINILGECSTEDERNDSKNLVDGLELGQTQADVHLSLANTSPLKSQTWHVADKTSPNTCAYKKEKNNNYVIESVASDTEVDVCKPIVLVQRLILKRNKHQPDHKHKSVLNTEKIVSAECALNNDRKSVLSDKSKGQTNNSKVLAPTTYVDDHVHKRKQNCAKSREPHVQTKELFQPAFTNKILEYQDHMCKTSSSSETETKVSRKKSKNSSMDVQNEKHSNKTSKIHNKGTQKNSDDCVKELPRVIIKRSPDGSTKYKSFLCLSAATEKHWQPVVILKRDADIEDLVKQLQKCKFSSPVVDKKLEHKSGSTSSDAAMNNHKIKHKESIHISNKKDCGNAVETKVKFISRGSETNTNKRSDKYDPNELNTKTKNPENLIVGVNFQETVCNPFESTKGNENDIESTFSVNNSSVHAKTGEKFKNTIKKYGNAAEQGCKSYKSDSKCKQQTYSIEMSSMKQRVDFNCGKDFDNIPGTTTHKHYKKVRSVTDTKCFINTPTNKNNTNESFHASNNSEFYSIHHSSTKNKNVKEKIPECKELVKFSNKRHSECQGTEAAIKKQCFWNGENSQTDHITSRCTELLPGVSVSSDRNFDILGQHKDEMRNPNSQCSLVCEGASFQNSDLKTGNFRPIFGEKERENCQACGMILRNLAERSSHIRQHPYHCQRCHLAFKSEGEFISHLSLQHPKTKEQHHCLLCEKSFTNSEKYQMHLQGRMHRHVELTQRRTIHTIFTLLTGKACPGLTPLTDAEVEGLGWFPSEPGTVHFYHQATPLQMAVQGWLNYQKDKCASGTEERNKT